MVKKNYNDIYEKIFKESNEFFKNYRKQNIIEFILLFILLIIINLMTFYASKLLFWINLFVSIGTVYFIIIYKKSKIRTLYKRKIINSLISEFNENFEYIEHMGLSNQIYEKSGFNVRFEDFKSDDLIIGNLKDSSKINLSEIIVFEKIIKRNIDNTIGSLEKVKTFQGLFGFIELKYPIKNAIRVSSKKFFEEKYRKQMQAEDFQKIFEVSAVDNENVLKIFTPELIKKMEKFSEKIRKPFEIEISFNNIFVRCNCGELFEPPKINKEIDYKMLLKYYEILSYTIDIVEDIIENSKK